MEHSDRLTIGRGHDGVMNHSGSQSGHATGQVFGDIPPLHKVLFGFLQSREVESVSGSGAGRHGVHAPHGPKETLLFDHGAHHLDHTGLLPSTRQGLHARLNKDRKENEMGQ